VLEEKQWNEENKAVLRVAASWLKCGPIRHAAGSFGFTERNALCFRTAAYAHGICSLHPAFRSLKWPIRESPGLTIGPPKAFVQDKFVTKGGSFHGRRWSNLFRAGDVPVIAK
jgi:hypothetical protein